MSVKLREGVMAVVFAAFDDSMKEVLALVNKTAYNILACMSCRDDLLFWQPPYTLLHSYGVCVCVWCVCVCVCGVCVCVCERYSGGERHQENGMFGFVTEWWSQCEGLICRRLQFKQTTGPGISHKMERKKRWNNYPAHPHIYNPLVYFIHLLIHSLTHFIIFLIFWGGTGGSPGALSVNK